MKEARVQIDQHGRLLFPAKIRKEHKIKPGDVFIMRTIDDEIKMTSLSKAIQNAQMLFKKHAETGASMGTDNDDTSSVEEQLEFRKEECKPEDKKRK